MQNDAAEYTFTRMNEDRAHWVVPRVYSPPRELRFYLDACFVTEYRDGRNTTERGRRLPEGAAYIVFLRGKKTEACDGADSALVFGGPHDCIHDIPTWDYHFQYGLRIQPGAAGLVLGAPAATLTNRIVPLRELWGARADRLFDSLLGASSDSEALGLMASTVGAVLLERRDADLTTVRLARAVRRATGDLRIKQLALDVGLSVRTLERRFRDGVGLSPKQYQRVARLANMLATTKPMRGDWAAIASDCGYYDQAHLVDDCNAILGRPPERFLRSITKPSSLEIGLVFDSQVGP